MLQLVRINASARRSQRFRPPTSSRRPAFNRAWLVDVAWACLSGWIALMLRNSDYVQPSMISTALQYVMVTTSVAAVVFLWFRSGNTLSAYFNTRDALNLAKAAVTTLALSSLILASLTRIEGLPRTIFVVHFLLLIAGAVTWRLLYRSLVGSSAQPRPRTDSVRDNILLVGANRFGLLYSQLVDEFQSGHRQIIGFLDDRPAVSGRCLNGHPVVGVTADIEKISAEYETHGIEINRVVFAGGPADFAPDVVAFLEAFADARGIVVEFLSETLSVEPGDRSAAGPITSSIAAAPVASQGVGRGGYWYAKRAIDIAVSAILLIITAPLMLAVAAGTAIDVGAPVVFWQQRLGRRGARFQVYKFRTLKVPVDKASGLRLSDEARLSSFGSLIRLTRLDELPQLINVLTGEMSLIGPRPLLPIDQPEDASARLAIRPGITGWAQVHGGRDLTPSDKAALDEWYCRHASVWVDLKVVLKTLQTIVFGEGRNAEATRRALYLAEAMRNRAAA